MKSNSVMTKTVVGTTIAWLFKDGKSISIDVAKLTPAIRADAEIHGITQKVADAAAMKVNPADGKSASVADKRAAMEKVIAVLLSGEWSGPREGGDGFLLQALAVVYPKRTPEYLREYVKERSSAERATLADSPKIKAEIDKLRAARVKAAGIDDSSMLDELANLPDDADTAKRREQAIKK